MNFKNHISNIFKKARNQLSAISRLQTFMGHKEKEAIIKFLLLHSNFNFITHQMLLIKSIVYTSILKILLIWKKSLRAFGANIWNTLPKYIKLTTSLLEFKKFIKMWLEPKCKCSVFKWEWNFLLNMILVLHNILRRWIQSPVKHLRWSFFRSS